MRTFTSRPAIGAALLIALSSLATACTATGSSTEVDAPDGSIFPSDSTEPEAGTSPSASTDYDALFGPPSSNVVTPDVLNGVWTGFAFQAQDLRLKLSSGSFVLAWRCDASTTVGLTAVARVTTSSIALLESKNATPPSTHGAKVPAGCAIAVRPLEVSRCTATTESGAEAEGLRSDNGCFLLAGTKLAFYSGTSGGILYGTKLTKLSD